MSDDKITLDRKTFKILASRTRVEILKSLDRRRKTLSELSKQFGMSVSTIKEHLDNLVDAELIEQKDEGRKWKYYELTKKGRGILHPEDKKIWLLLAVSIIGAVVVAADMWNSLMSMNAAYIGVKTFASRQYAPMMTANMPYLHIIALVLLFAVIAISATKLYDQRHSIFKRV
ncbi:MAG: winged helix-turn-helix transcriptional regulator [Candidatus Aenigmarchaeota archaeon]|nr:winged helix-turn-helix transcriptional regulator [Candidatus Aenigmarchaeota archaeon]